MVDIYRAASQLDKALESWEDKLSTSPVTKHPMQVEVETFNHFAIQGFNLKSPSFHNPSQSAVERKWEIQKPPSLDSKLQSVGVRHCSVQNCRWNELMGWQAETEVSCSPNLALNPKRRHTRSHQGPLRPKW